LDVASVNIQFEDYETAKSFHVDYRIRAANIPEEIKGNLHVIIEKE
jgi:hypothetical protein